MWRNFGGAEAAAYCGLSVGDTIQFYENGTPTEEFTIIAKAAATDGDVTVTGGGSNIAQIIEGPRIFMAENKFKEIYETPTLYGFLFDVEEQYQQEMETYLAQDTDVAYTSILTMKATVSGVKNVVLLIGGTEAVAIRKIFELYTSSEIGLGGIANQLNLQGIRKIPRQNGTLEDWTGHFIKLILDNPVYCGKIAYGRRTKEKVKGTKNDYQMKRNDDYILTEGQHKGIVSEEVWEKAHAKRLRTGVKQPSKIGRDRVHLLSGLLKCPVCGSPMYTNKHAWTNKDGTYKEIYYYVCSRNRMVRGKHCEYKAMLKKTDIEPMVIEAIREIVRNEEYAQAIKKRIGVQIDTKAVDKELEGYQAKLKEVDLNKTRLEREIDSLPADAKYRERKLHDMTLRLDSLYDVIVELEEKIEDTRLRRDAIKQQAITLENIYKIMVNFDCVYNIINDEEKRNVVTALIKEIEIYRNDESEYPLKRIGLNFPVFKDGGEVTELLWDKGNTVETVVLLSKGEVDSKKIRVEFSLEDMDMSEFQDGATYPQIKEYVLEHSGLKVSNLYISQIKRKCGIEVGKNYNLPKSEDSRQPQCPPEKEKAIREAFKYFGMI